MEENKLQILKYPMAIIERNSNNLKKTKTKEEKILEIDKMNRITSEQFYKSKWMDLICKNNEVVVNTVFHANKFVEEQLIKPIIDGKLFILSERKKVKEGERNGKSFELLSYTLKRNLDIWM